MASIFGFFRFVDCSWEMIFDAKLFRDGGFRVSCCRGLKEVCRAGRKEGNQQMGGWNCGERFSAALGMQGNSVRKLGGF